MSFKPTKEQVTNKDLVASGSNVKIIAGAGTGKAQPLTELVLTPSGFVTMKDINKGDIVIGDKGEFIQVIQTYEHADLNMYRLTFSDGSQAESCEDHLWEVRELNWKTGVRRQEPVVRTLKELLPRIQKEKKTKKPYPYSVRLTCPIQFNTCAYIVHPYLMGYVLGNGSSAIAALKVAVGEEDYNEILSYIGNEHVLSEYQNVSSKVRYFNLSIFYRKAYEDLGLYRVKSLQKFIPKEYLIGSIEQRIELLRGLMDSDGTCTKNKCRFSSSSAQLILDVEQLVRSLGGVASTSISHREDKNWETPIEYSISIRVPFNPFHLKRKAIGYKILPTDMDGDKRIISAEFIGKQAGKCLLVDSDKQLYITRDYTITHNSSSLRYNAVEIPHLNFLVLCFNKANADESNKHPDRPANIFYSTVHSLAYRAIISKTVGLKAKLAAYLNYADIGENDTLWGLFSQREDYTDLEKTINRAILDTTAYWCRSDATDIVPYATGVLSRMFSEDFKEGSISTGKLLDSREIEEIAFIVERYWSSLIDAKSTAKITHDVYLKMFQLSKCYIESIWDDRSKSYVSVNVIVIDESQDTNPVAESIFSKQFKQKVMVGDPMQQLYAWRGAGKMMDGFKDFSVGFLTESFRFNERIAKMANIVLEESGSELRLIGSGEKTLIDTRAHLCRTNAAVVEAMFSYIEDGKQVYTSINLKDVFSKLYHIQACRYNEPIKYPCKEFANIIDRETLKKAADFSDEVARYIKLGEYIKKNGMSLGEVKTFLEGRICRDPSDADIVVSTIHAAKGMEYASVVIDEDFIAPMQGESVSDMIERLFHTEALYCLLYVAITRAEVEIEVPFVLRGFLDARDKETLEDKDLLKQKVSLLKPSFPVQDSPFVVYDLFDKSGALLFIGVTCNFENRLMQHAREDKAWYGLIDAGRTRFAKYYNRPEAYKARATAIADRQPKYSEIFKTKIKLVGEDDIEEEEGFY